MWSGWGLGWWLASSHQLNPPSFLISLQGLNDFSFRSFGSGSICPIQSVTPELSQLSAVAVLSLPSPENAGDIKQFSPSGCGHQYLNVLLGLRVQLDSQSRNHVGTSHNFSPVSHILTMNVSNFLTFISVKSKQKPRWHLRGKVYSKSIFI